MNYNNILKQWTDKSNFNEITEEQLLKLSNQYPSSAIPYLLITKYKIEKNILNPQNAKLSLFVHNPIYTNYILNQPILIELAEEIETNIYIQKAVEEQFKIFQQKLDPADLTNLEILNPKNLGHTIDYFASQNISEIKKNDNLSNQLKSFTAWLQEVNKNKLKNVELKITIEQEEKIQLIAENANQQIEIDTESMAEIFAKQGKKKQAINIYLKLIDDFPKKSTYFAEKIEQLNLKN